MHNVAPVTTFPFLAIRSKKSIGFSISFSKKNTESQIVFVLKTTLFSFIKQALENTPSAVGFSLKTASIFSTFCSTQISSWSAKKM